MMVLPIDALRERFLEAVASGPVVLSSPTGSGKSTQVPRWLQARGRVLVVEPRRVACRALAARVAELEGTALGEGVGYVVRDERCARSDTAILFVTPGVALRMLRSGDAEAHFSTLVLDEFHERSLDLDLLLALSLIRSARQRLVVMSATLEGDRVASHVGGVHLAGEGRLYPVVRHHVPGHAEQPEVRGLEARVQAALDRAAADPGDVLVFLPGKGEIHAVESSLRGDFEILTLHGGLTLAQQSRIFAPNPRRRRVILSTNVAETSLTVPGVGVVVDAGLLRRTQYHQGRGYLTLLPIAMDSAEQRAGRAGRLGPGVCYRLWPATYSLDAMTPPEIHREDLVPLVLAAAACGVPEARSLPFLDPPRDYAIDDARESLRLLDAIDDTGAITARGEALFGLPLDPPLGRLLMEAHARHTLSMVIPLVAALSTPRRLFVGRPADPALDLRDGGCDASALIRAVTEGRAGPNQLDAVALREARTVADRLRGMWPDARGGGSVDREALAMTVLAAWPQCAYLARRRKREVAWSNGGTEVALGQESAVDADKAEALVVLDSRAFGLGHRKRQIVITAAMPVPLSWLVRSGRGRERLGSLSYRNDEVQARIERVYAGAVIGQRDEVPVGALAREAVRDLVLRGQVMPGLGSQLSARHAEAALAAQLAQSPALLPLPAWLLARLEALGLQHPEDVALLAPEDLLPPAPPPDIQDQIARLFPQQLSIGDARYVIRYDVPRRVATLHQVDGLRKDPPPERYLPRLPGWALELEQKNRVRTLRER